ncbi:hypothetical protein ADIARSV_1378 [Arcticibacter svalbardensis MN12-7]|uniref:Uncharacterized protein n=1 Tax=Arcticibacter svalbardensis MN12-7 TaxID=1150600 RepID=R9GUC6_9SPHI|nr:hypothetical protein [Arcticibacter svalbardensis]EOR95462.1 hypothetical protein ADIARSV_1378 [Arcticibacter svalbardensis MN12-7]
MKISEKNTITVFEELDGVNSYEIKNKSLIQSIFHIDITKEKESREATDVSWTTSIADSYTAFRKLSEDNSFILKHLKQPRNISINPLDDFRASSQHSLLEFNKAVNESRYILELAEGWDGDSGQVITTELFTKSSNCIGCYIKSIFLEQNFILESPAINPVPNGSIDFEWRNTKGRLLINFRYINQEIIAYFYGDLYNNKLAIKGNIPTKKVYDHLMKWMQNLQITK